MSRREKSKVKNNWIFKVIVVAVFLILVILVLKISGNYVRNDIVGKINLIINNSNVTEDLKKDIFIDENDVIYISKTDITNFFDNYIYYDEQYNQIITSSENKIANMVVGAETAIVNNAEIKLESPVIEQDGEYYIPFSELDDVYNVSIQKVNDVIIVDSLNRKYQIATSAKNINVKSQPTLLSRTVDKIESGDTVVISKRSDDIAKDGWKRIRTNNG